MENLQKIIEDLGEKGEYKKQGETFLENTNTKMTVAFVGVQKHFPEDKEERLVYNVTL